MKKNNVSVMAAICVLVAVLIAAYCVAPATAVKLTRTVFIILGFRILETVMEEGKEKGKE